ncbi:MAG: hypothetical protein IKY33_01025 [Clostridia bacterium]|nr:hypothetical protein [Clostridia bacterium]
MLPSVNEIAVSNSYEYLHKMRRLYDDPSCASFLTYAERDESAWFVSPPEAAYDHCCDSFYG